MYEDKDRVWQFEKGWGSSKFEETYLVYVERNGKKMLAIENLTHHFLGLFNGTWSML